MKLIKKELLLIIFSVFIVGFLISGCKNQKTDLKFNHKLHVVENEIECSTCHKSEDGKMDNPDMDTCSDCHDIGDVDSPTKDCLMCHTISSSKKDYEVEEGVKEKPESYKDLIFTHEPHEDYKCSKCHEGIDNVKSLQKIDWPSMDKCKECHDGDTAPIECETCHSKIRKDKAPESHNGAWGSKHGLESKFDDSCRFCHDPNFKKNGKFCQDCHRIKKPKDHNFNWKTSQHGMEAIHDRKVCATCHTASYCADCHKSEKPISHKRGDWVKFKPEPGHAEAAKKNFRSCNVCHKTSDCTECHNGMIMYNNK